MSFDTRHRRVCRQSTRVLDGRPDLNSSVKLQRTRFFAPVAIRPIGSASTRHGDQTYATELVILAPPRCPRSRGVAGRGGPPEPGLWLMARRRRATVWRCRAARRRDRDGRSCWWGHWSRGCGGEAARPTDAAASDASVDSGGVVAAAHRVPAPGRLPGRTDSRDPKIVTVTYGADGDPDADPKRALAEAFDDTITTTPWWDAARAGYCDQQMPPQCVGHGTSAVTCT